MSFSIQTHVRETLGEQNLRAQEKDRDFDCIIGSGTERPPKYKGWATLRLDICTLMELVSSFGLARVQVSLNAAFLISLSCGVVKWKF